MDSFLTSTISITINGGCEKHASQPKKTRKDDDGKQSQHRRQLNRPALDKWHQQIPFDLLDQNA